MAAISILAVLLLAGAGGLSATASSSIQFNNVQVLVQTSQDLPYSYTLTAYNTSGYQVAYYQSNFPAAALELPDGTYLFTVQASFDQSVFPCVACVMPAGSTTVMAAASVTNGSGVEPIFRLAPTSNEYGYAVDNVTGPSSITIDTQNSSALPTTQVSVHVAYANGTAAQGAWVYGSVVDDSYFYGSNDTVSGAQTGVNGTAVLIMPRAPLLVTSYLSVPITLPQTQSNVTVIIGGQKVNVTLYWQPSSITLEGQTLVLPPQTSGSITLHYQSQLYYPIPYVSSSAPGSSGASTTETATANTAAAANQNTGEARIPPFRPSDVLAATSAGSSTTAAPVQGSGGASLLLIVALVITVAALSSAFVALRAKRKQNAVSA